MPDPGLTITVNLAERCPKCGKRGATVRKDGTFGPCLACVTKLVIQRSRKKARDA